MRGARKGWRGCCKQVASSLRASQRLAGSWARKGCPQTRSFAHQKRHKSRWRILAGSRQGGVQLCHANKLGGVLEPQQGSPPVQAKFWAGCMLKYYGQGQRIPGQLGGQESRRSPTVSDRTPALYSSGGPQRVEDTNQSAWRTMVHAGTLTPLLGCGGTAGVGLAAPRASVTGFHLGARRRRWQLEPLGLLRHPGTQGCILASLAVAGFLAQWLIFELIAREE